MTTTLTTETIPHPEMTRLYLRFSETRFDIMVYNQYEENSLIYSSKDLSGGDDGAPDKTAIIEGVVYDNPVLVNGEFERVGVLIDSAAVTLIPEGAGDIESIFKYIYGDEESRGETVVGTTGYDGVAIASGVEPRLLNFVRRTWPEAQIYHPLQPLIAFTRHKAADGSRRMFVDIEGDITCIVTLTSEQLFYASRYATTDVNDIAYYVMATLQSQERGVDEIIVAGTQSKRAALIETLRRFHPYVMPAIFPSALHRAGARGENIPWDLMIMPLTV